MTQTSKFNREFFLINLRRIDKKDLINYLFVIFNQEPDDYVTKEKRYIEQKLIQLMEMRGTKLQVLIDFIHNNVSVDFATTLDWTGVEIKQEESLPKTIRV